MAERRRWYQMSLLEWLGLVSVLALAFAYQSTAPVVDHGRTSSELIARPHSLVELVIRWTIASALVVGSWLFVRLYWAAWKESRQRS